METAFTSKEFVEYCSEQGHFSVTDLSRGSGQLERINSSIISILPKLSIDDSTKWYKHVDNIMRMINLTYQRSVNNTPFEMKIGVKMWNKNA